jgi:hypothetical protein
LETASCTRLGLTRTRIEPWQVVRSQTRLHRDLDLALDADNEAVALPALERRGYRLETDWRLVRVELVAGGPRLGRRSPGGFRRHRAGPPSRPGATRSRSACRDGRRPRQTSTPGCCRAFLDRNRHLSALRRWRHQHVLVEGPTCGQGVESRVLDFIGRREMA